MGGWGKPGAGTGAWEVSEGRSGLPEVKKRGMPGASQVPQTPFKVPISGPRLFLNFWTFSQALGLGLFWAFSGASGPFPAFSGPRGLFLWASSGPF